uniref:Uncharacterized protein n=1 Tax=Candidatus Kentrum sp. MB TaxID=2138164 RepID=A0A451BDU3_9GAMM|nr:MAG: hypothetical protein BECKMB1821G_GA0114241_105414 [Candidatus Kentron sp. MB]VFK35805.1 MAG: hypothetical protein BECKMB1821I_GA0114274_11482 [Candidatus Kentron sp. MB]VFK76449.1 MAG: hypothetical protein BECKMB1821H_GA0114242_10577 [Candidatus Kentron sp. MB]
MMKKHLSRLFFTALFSALMIHVDVVLAVDVAPRISDREIIERLTRLEEGQQSIRREIAQRFSSMEQRFLSMEQRMDTMQKQTEQRMETMQKQTEQRMEAMQKQTEQRMDTMQKQTEQRMEAMQKQTEQRFLSVEKRMDAQWNLTLALIMAIIGLVGFVIWDRKTALKPLERRFERIADELECDLGVASPEGSRLTRLIAALREIALGDPQLSERIREALRRHSLLEETPQRV